MPISEIKKRIPKSDVNQSNLDSLLASSSSDDEEDEDVGSKEEVMEATTCAAHCGKPPQSQSIYCSVECVLNHAKMMEKNKKPKVSFGHQLVEP